MTDIHRVHLTKAKLAAMPEAERSLLLLLGHASNEINVLTKLILMTRKDDPPVKLIDHVEAGQILVLMRVLIGKLHEAWRLFGKRFQADRAIREKYSPQLSPKATGALTELNRHFGNGSLLTRIRNNISFHYVDDNDLIEANFQRLPETEAWDFYLSEAIVNSFYFASELVVQGGLSSLSMGKPAPTVPTTDFSDDAAAFRKIYDAVIEISCHITELFGQVIAEIVEAHIPDVEVTTVEIPNGPKLSTYSLPFFVDVERGARG
jgi:hypothetical protein